MAVPQALSPIHKRHAFLASRMIDAALGEGWEAGHRLTEQELATMLDVSRTPVRSALRLLAELGVVQAGPGRGYVLARTGQDLAGVSVQAVSDPEETLRAALIRDRLAGRLDASETQAELGRRYAAAAPVVRRVLRRMEEEGLVLHDGWRWEFVATLETEHSRRASFELRMLVEPAALLIPGFAVRPDELVPLSERHEALMRDPHGAGRDPAATFMLDARFHETLASFTDNPFVLNIVRQQNALRRLLEMGTYADARRVLAWCREHMAIVEAVLGGRQQEASALMARHLAQARAASERTRQVRR